MLRLLTTLSALSVVVTIAGCPPPPEPPHDAGVVPDAGTLGVAGDECFSPTKSNNCALGLECGALKDADAGVFACVVPADEGGACFFNSGTEPKAPDDGCKSGLLCGGHDTCVLKGALDAPCKSPADCTSVNCGLLNDGSGQVCVVNDCLAGCPAGDTCKQAGLCGLTCAVAPTDGQPCIVPGTDACSPVSQDCADGLQCFHGDPATGVTCGVPGGGGAGCNLATAQSGCQQGFFCDSGTQQCQHN